MKQGQGNIKIKTPAGAIGVRISSAGVQALSLPAIKPKIKVLRSPIKKRAHGHHLPSAKIEDSVKEFLGRYFNGDKITGRRIMIDFQGYSVFDRKVLKYCRAIPYARRVTYKELAERVGRPLAVRAVGNALGKNRTPVIIPCHRVVRENGDVGGYSSGSQWKSCLLNLEERVAGNK